MESNQEQKKISSENNEGHPAQSSSKRRRNKRRAKRHRTASSAAPSSAQPKQEQDKQEQVKKDTERSSDVSKSGEKTKSHEKTQQNTAYETADSQHGGSSEVPSKANSAPKAEDKALKDSDLKTQKKESDSKQASVNEEKAPKDAEKDALKKTNESSREKEKTEPLPAEKAKENVKQEKSKEQAASGSKAEKKEELPAKRKKPRKRHGITFYVVIFTFFVVIGSAAAMATLFWSSNNAFFANIPEVELPVFTKMNVDEILNNQEYANFRFRIEEIYSNEIEAGIVADQSPKPPKSVKENAVITLKVSKGPESISVPSVIGWNRDTAREKFKDLGLSVLIQSESDRNVAPNKVIRTSPEAGAVVQAGDVITLYVSRSISESTIVTIPNCVGSSQESAKSQLSRLGLVGLTVIKDGSEPAGTVISQSPSAGTKTGVNDTVQLYVSNGKQAAGGAGVTGGLPAQEGQQLYPGGPMVGNADGQVVPGSVTGHIHTWQTISGTNNQVCTVCGATR